MKKFAVCCLIFNSIVGMQEGSNSATSQNIENEAQVILSINAENTDKVVEICTHVHFSEAVQGEFNEVYNHMKKVESLMKDQEKDVPSDLFIAMSLIRACVIKQLKADEKNIIKFKQENSGMLKDNKRLNDLLKARLELIREDLGNLKQTLIKSNSI